MSSDNEAPHKNQSFIDQAIPWLQNEATFDEAMDFYDATANDPECDDWTLAELGKRDRYFLLVHVLHAHYAVHPWLYDRAREVERNPDGYLDLWAREHFKSTIITYAGIIQEILKDPEITIGVFSHTRPTSKQFLAQIKREFESNEVLKRLYPDICYENPRAQAPFWSLDSGIVVNRKTNPREATVEAHGLVDGQPTGKHFKLLVYDDVVTISSVTTADQILKTTNAWEISLNLGSAEEDGEARMWMIGTRYNYADTYHTLLERGAVKRRIYAATDDGTITGKPIFWSQKRWEDKLRTSSLYNIACQQLQNPNAGGQAEFTEERHCHYYEVRPHTLNVFIMCDYAGSRKSTGSSRTAFAVIGVDAHLNKYLLDGACHRIGLAERWTTLRNLRRKWMRQPGVQYVSVGYERFGAQSDIDYFEEKMKETGESFHIEELNWPADGDVAKDNRIRRLEPDMRNWSFFLPYDGEKTRLQNKTIMEGNSHLLAKPIKVVDEENRIYNLVDYLINTELLFFPNTTAKDLIDAASRIYDMNPVAPVIIDENDLLPEEEAFD